MKGYFVTGTDTEVGKTLVSAALLRRAAGRYSSVLGLKPIASGASWQHGQLVNEDALLLQQGSQPRVEYARVNPWVFAPAIAPHLAAQQQGQRLSLDAMQAWFAQQQADFCLLEGAGGWLVPINESHSLSDFVVQQGLPVILVVGMKLGAINHALLTAEVIRRQGSQLVAWVGNALNADFEPDQPQAQALIQVLRQRLDAPCLGLLPRLPMDLQARVLRASELLLLPEEV